ncbi:MAG: hypothetical protein CMF42_02525 [Legionellales bacterium]|nr:hypothetical protein [Legionellales bacterium]OUX67655.1 MAG: hypothetical protein CBD38_01390 [bacterium TMED178]
MTLTLLHFVLFYVATKRLLTYLHILQQDDYAPLRFLNWLWVKKSIDRYMTITLSIGTFTIWLFGSGVFISNIISTLCLLIVLFISYRERVPTKSGKKLLVMTSRATRIYCVCLLLSLPSILQTQTLLEAILMIHCIPFILIIGCYLLQPIESMIYRYFIIKAQRTLQSHNPVVIGITGSYGKTSLKKILGHILSKYEPTLMTPGSVNTPMGICKVIKDDLKPSHKYFIVEMGAYYKQSIAKLCDLTRPVMGIVSSIGPCHLERFGSIDNIAIGKSELIQSVATHPHAKGFTFPKALNQYPIFHKMSQSKLMIEPLTAQHKEQTINGLSMSIEHQGEAIDLSAPIFGLHQIDNILLATTIALQLGVPMQLIKSALKSLPQIPSRLEVQEDHRHVTWINDAYNANPEGFKQGITLLNEFGVQKSGRKILVTPGIVELGQAHDPIHESLAKEAMRYVDVIIAVSHQRIKAFVRTCHQLKQGNQQIITTLTFKDAKKWLDENVQPKDTILISNDLPDLLESRPAI